LARFVPVEVQTYAGYKADEAPLGFSWLGRHFTIEQIVDRWYQAARDPRLPSASYFKARTTDGDTVILKRDDESTEWFLQVADSPA